MARYLSPALPSKAHLPCEMSPTFCLTYLAPALLARVMQGIIRASATACVAEV